MNKRVLLPLLLVSTQVMAAQNYCAGVRGNGELAPAHWGSLARIVENKGLPQTMAGGSSAAITLFLMDAISRNEAVNGLDGLAKNNQQALMLKTLVPHILYLVSEDAKAPVIMRMVSNITGIMDDGFFNALKKAVKIAADAPTFFRTLGEYGPLLNPEMAAGIRRNFSFYKGQIAEAIKVFGAFDAKTDQNIFYRKGLVDFKFLGILFGRVADFYAGYGHDRANAKLESFLSSCGEASRDKNWSELVVSNPECKTKLYEALDSYYGPVPGTKKVERIGKTTHTKKVWYKRTFPNKMIFEKVGSGLNTFPTTSVVLGDAVTRYKTLLEKYEKNEAKDVEDFSLDFDTELKYGYWGTADGLSKIKTGLRELYNDDLKSKKFMPINDGVWFEVLGTSPAEPGLSNLQRIPYGPELNERGIINKRYFYKKRLLGIFPWPSFSAIEWFDEENPTKSVVPFREAMYSAGGWSDLHPTLVLHAHGCEDIVYVTRQGGESVFGQQIFIRLTGYTDKISFWKEIKEGNRRGWTNLSSEEENSPWNRLYNLMNPYSSYNESITTASAIYCTDWDKYYVLKGEVGKALKDAYHAPIFVNDIDLKDSYSFGGSKEGKSPDGFPGCVLKDFNQ